jgi:RNA polymerase primary sigma factor
MSQSELAAQLDVTRAAVSAWITGRAEPRMDNIQAIEKILGLATGSTVTRDETPASAGVIGWYFRPAHADGGREMGNAAAFAFDSDLRVLAREATQNSLDERDDQARPVRVRYQLHELTGERMHGFLSALRWNELLPHFEAAADKKQKVGRVLAAGLRDLEDTGRLLLLRVDDYNAAGLTGPDYDNGRFAAVVRRQLDSHKGAAAGGSFGLGKATLWAASQFGLVLMNSTLSEPHEGHRRRRVIGRLDLPWHEVGGEQFAGPAWLGEADLQRDRVARSWWADEGMVRELNLTRANEDPGTSFLIVGAHDAAGEATDLESMHEMLVKDLASSFWASMVVGRDHVPLLEASVEARRDGEVVVAEERVDPHLYQPARSRAMRAFLNGETTDRLADTEDVVLAKVPLTVPPKRDEAGGVPAPHEAVLLVTPTSDSDGSPNRLVCMRSSRMVVIQRPVTDVPLGSRQFQAILLAGRATGSEEPDANRAEEFLRAAEPPEHNDWKQTDDLTVTYARGAVSRIREFRQAMIVKVRDIVRPAEVMVDDTPTVLKDLLRLDLPSATRSAGYPTIKSAPGEVDSDGAWRVRVEVRLPERDDPWLLTPVLRFATRSGTKPKAEWSEIIPETNCELTAEGDLKFPGNARTAAFKGISRVDSHPVRATMAIAEVDLERVKENRR